MSKCSLPSPCPVCALERTAPVNAASEILDPVRFPGKGPIGFSGAGFLKRTEMFLHSVLWTSTGIYFQRSVVSVCYWHIRDEEGDVLRIFFQPCERTIPESLTSGVVSKPCTSALHSQPHGTETVMLCCSPQYGSFFGVRNREGL